jgi:hypothetical protein
MVAACTLYKQHIFDSPAKLELLQDMLFEAAQVYERELYTWALFSNNTRFITRSLEDGASLKRLIQHLHSQSARLVNQIDGSPGRRVWFQHWDTCLTY